MWIIRRVRPSTSQSRRGGRASGAIADPKSSRFSQHGEESRPWDPEAPSHLDGAAVGTDVKGALLPAAVGSGTACGAKGELVPDPQVCGGMSGG